MIRGRRNKKQTEFEPDYTLCTMYVYNSFAQFSPRCRYVVAVVVVESVAADNVLLVTHNA